MACCPAGHNVRQSSGGWPLQSGSRYTSPVAARGSDQRRLGEAVVLRYVTTDGRIEMCWPCRVVEDRDDLVALFIAAGSPYKAGPKKTAAEKRRQPRYALATRRVRVAQRYFALDVPRADRTPSRYSGDRTRGRAGCSSTSSIWKNRSEEPRSASTLRITRSTSRSLPSWLGAGATSRSWPTTSRRVSTPPNWRKRPVQRANEPSKPSDGVTTSVYEVGRNGVRRRNGEVPPFIDGWDTTPPTFWDRRQWAYGTSA